MPHINNRFNLVDEAWIPVAGVGLVSLRDIFSKPDLTSLGGNAMEKIALIKLFLAIAQAAATPADIDEWADLKPQGTAKKCLDYLEKHKQSFFLYGEKPFLQMPQISGAEKKAYGAILPHIATGNTTVLFDQQNESPLSDADKALLTVLLGGFGFGGKKTDNSIVLSPGYLGKSNDKGKSATGKPGPWIGFAGYLHYFLVGRTIWHTIWFNLFSKQEIARNTAYPFGIGTPPWEKCPAGETCSIAKALSGSLMGRLTPMSKFFSLADDGIHYSDGIPYATHKEGGVDPSIPFKFAGKDIKALWADPEKQPWRNLTGLLGFLQNDSPEFTCMTLSRLQHLRQYTDLAETIAIWAGGIQVSSNAGEQYSSGTNDFIDSTVYLENSQLGETWFGNLKQEMAGLDALAKSVYSATATYYKELNVKDSPQAQIASGIFWKLCDSEFPNLLVACENETTDMRQIMRQKIAKHAVDAYNACCPNDTGRQLTAWAKCTPNTGKYINMNS